jgi:hypothetical protein
VNVHFGAQITADLDAGIGTRNVVETAPYREQILTYSTGLALTGRSAACAPLMATIVAAEPSTRLLTIFMFNLQVALQGRFRIRRVRRP